MFVHACAVMVKCRQMQTHSCWQTPLHKITKRFHADTKPVYLLASFTKPV